MHNRIFGTGFYCFVKNRLIFDKKPPASLQGDSSFKYENYSNSKLAPQNEYPVKTIIQVG
jgi:hypothetical protein